MSDNELRERIAGLLIAHPSGLRAVGDPPDWPWAVADAILALPGIAVVELPEHDAEIPTTEDENGYREWSYPHGHIAATDYGTVMWGMWHIHDPDKVRAAAAALLAAADYAERER